MADLIKKTDTLNQGREKLNAAIEHVDTFQRQIDEIVVEGDSSVEAAQARVEPDGTVNPTLKARLDKKETEFSAQLAQNAIQVKSRGISTDVIEDLEQALLKVKESGGHRLQLEAGVYAISRPLIISNLGIKIDCIPYRTRIIPTENFVGEELIRFEQDEENVYKGIDLGGLLVDCNNVQANGITVVNAYDQFKFSNVEVRYVNDGYIPFNFIQSDNGRIGQTLLIENCIGYHYGDTSDKPVWYLEEYQEVNMIGTKAFGSLANTGVSNGIGYHFVDCKSVTMTGASNSFCKDGVVIEARTKNCYGFVINGMKNEEVGDCAVKTIVADGLAIGALTVTAPVDQNGMGSFELSGVNNSTLYTSYAPVTIDSRCSNVTIFTGLASAVVDNGLRTTIIGMKNADENYFQVNKEMAVVSENTPIFTHRIKGANKRITQRYSATPTNDYGFITEITDESNNTTPLMRMLKEYLALYANGEEIVRTGQAATNQTGLMVLCNIQGVQKMVKVLIGELDSGGAGHRVLRIPNNI